MKLDRFRLALQTILLNDIYREIQNKQMNIKKKTKRL